MIGEKAYCLNCGGVVDGAQGHAPTCLTMVARRILANERWLHAQQRAPQGAPGAGVGIDAAHQAP
jgi:hypothetical protein